MLSIRVFFLAMQVVQQLPALLERLLQGECLAEEDAAGLMQAWLENSLSAVQTGAFLAALRCRTPSAIELSAMALVLRAAAPLPCKRPDGPLLDSCGTGGDGANSFNISTAVAFTAASCGVKVAKHGNRSASGKVGSADVLEGLGIQLTAPLESVVGAIDRAGVSFLFAPGWHGSLAALAPLRRNLGVRTIFNLLGPLVNPLAPEAQVLGVADINLLKPMAGALKNLGLQRAVVVYGHGGLDEASLAGTNELIVLDAGELHAQQLDPNAFGLSLAPLAELEGGDLVTNQEILKRVLQGNGSKAQREVVALNTALALWCNGSVQHWGDGVERALASLDSGEPWQRLLALRSALNPVAG